ncbi:MAG TPA: CDP-alcohol phosphatidyltransferase family protein [Sphingobacteriaceae bacterium]|nr:CDP-alcohol phosphatidyltransferase family protein [Sphingobacteriaceae bacterium]
MANPISAHIPNAITCLNLISGSIGVVFAFRGQFDLVAYCMLASGIFDFLDGMVARLLGVSSPIGKELDSLADVISFGLLPGVLYFQLLQQALNSTASSLDLAGLLPYLAFLVPAFSALRLAKFNLDERQESDFIGLNTPMNAFYVLSLPFIATQHPEIILHPAFLITSILLTCGLLISEIRLFSMKLKSLSWAANRYKYIFLILAAALLIPLHFRAIPLILVLYFILSALHFRGQKA